MPRQSKMMQYVNWKMRVTISDTRQLLGTFMAFDKHMNIVLGDTEEFRKIRGKKGADDIEEKRSLGMILLRGCNVVALTAEAPPAPKSRSDVVAARAGPGIGVAAGRGMPVAPLAAAPKGLAGPVRGIGGPADAMMMPQAAVSAAPVSYGRGAMPPGGAPPAGMPPMPGMPGRGMPMQPPPMMMMGMPPMPPGGVPPMMFGRGGPPPGMPPMGVPPMMGRGGPPPGAPPMMGRGGPPQ